MSRYNTLLLGSAERVAEALSDRDASPEELQAALVNALRMIVQLQGEVAELSQRVPDNR